MLNHVLKKLICLLFTLNSVLSIDNSIKEIVPLVHGGSDIILAQNKHLVKLEIYSNATFYSLCSGSIIHDRWILTAAHCLKDIEMAPRKPATCIAILSNKCGRLQEIARGSEVIVHSGFQYNDLTLMNAAMDIALLRANQSLYIPNCVQSIRLASRSVKVGQTAVIAGYGDSEVGTGFPRQGVVTIDDCKLMRMRQICSSGFVGAGSGDSGGPLVSKGRLVGVITSTSPDEKYSFYVNVVAYLDWIKETIKRKNIV